jgi:hypothetical protein
MRRVGFEGKLYWGAPNATAGTLLEIVRDASYKFDPTLADVSDRASIIDYSRVAGIKFGLDFETNNDDTNAFVAAVRLAASTGTLIAVRSRDKTSGWGCDGDFNVALDESQPLRDRQAMKISLTPCNDNRAVTWS